MQSKCPSYYTVSLALVMGFDLIPLIIAFMCIKTFYIFYWGSVSKSAKF